MESIYNITDQLFVSLQQAREHPQGVSGLSTGFDVLNKLTTGWQKGELIVIAAPPRMGKRAFALTMMNNTMYEGELGMFWFSTNLASMQLTKMLLCNNLNVEMQHLQRGKVEEEFLDEIIEKYTLSKLYFDDTPYLTIEDIDSKLDEQFEMHPINLVVIDDVNNLNYKTSPKLDLADKFYQLKALARKYEIPVIVLMETENPQKPILNHVNDCLSLSDYDAMSKSVDVRILLYRPEYYKITEFSDKSSTMGMAELIYSSRIGNGSVRLKFNPLFFKFSESNVSLNQCE
jgi:replicative DNA helicase